MTDLRRRGYDHGDSEPRPDPEGWRNREDPAELRLGWGQRSIQARGLATIVVVVGVALIIAVGYIVDNSERRAALAHDRLIRSSDRTGCLITFEQADRVKFREKYYEGAFKQWCPWVE